MATQESILRIEIDSKNAEKNAKALADELNRLQSSGDKAAGSGKNFQQVTNITNNIIQNFNTNISGANKSITTYTQTTNNAGKASREFGNQTRQTTSELGRQTDVIGSQNNAIRSLAGYMAGILTVGTAISKMDIYTSLQNRLKLVTTTQEELNTAMADTFRIAQNTGGAWESVAMVYQRFAENAKRLNISMEQTAALTETVSKAISISGGSAASAEAALMQFGQSLASGVLRGEEYNSIAEQAPALLKAIATGLDTDIGKLRAMAADGKITGDVLVESLTKAESSVNDLFGKTDFTIANSFTMLNNAVIQFVGEAGKASGSASLLSKGIAELAQNLSLIADIAVLGGISLLTKAILTQTVAIESSVTTAMARRAANLAELQATAQATAAEASRTAAIAQLRAMQLADAQATMVRMSGMQRLAYLQSTILPLEKANTAAIAEHAAATAADTAAQNANNVARSRSAMLLGAIGGPIGAITIGVTALAAGYMWLQNHTEKANQKLEKQGEVAKKTTEELKALTGAKLEQAKVDLAASFKAQNEELAKLSTSFNGYLNTIKSSHPQNRELEKIINDVRLGIVSQSEAIEYMNKKELLTDEQRKQGLDLVSNYELQRQKAQENANAQETLGKKVTLAGNAAQNAAGKINDNTNAMKGNEDAANKASDAQLKYAASLRDTTFSNTLQTELKKTGRFSDEMIKHLSTIGDEKRKAGLPVIFTNQDIELAQKAADAEIARAAAFKDTTKEREKASKAAETLRNKELKQELKAEEERAKLREQLTYEYSTDAQKAEIEHQRKLEDIRKAGFSPEVEANYIKSVQARFNNEKKLRDAQLAMDLNGYKLNEREKLVATFTIQKQIAEADASSGKAIRDERVKSLDDQMKNKLATLDLANDKKLFDAQQLYLSESEAMQRRYELERREIELTNSAIKEQLLSASRTAQNKAESDTFYTKRDEVAGKYSDVKTDMQEADPLAALKTQLEERNKIIKDAYDVDLINEDEYRKALSDSQLNYWVASKSYQVDMAKDISTSLLGVITDYTDESSNVYKTMLAIQKGANLASVLMNSVTAISAAWASSPFPSNLPAVAMATLKTGALQATLKAFSPKEGFATGGLIRGAGTGTSDSIPIMASNREFMVKAASVAKIGVDNLNYINDHGELPQNTRRVGSSQIEAINNASVQYVQPIININVPAGYEAKESVNSNGNVTIDIVKKVVKESWANLNDTNSYESKQLRGGYNVSPAR